MRQQPLDVGQEAEVEHLVGLVEHDARGRAPRSRWPCLARSSSRPGVPTTTSTPRVQRLDLRLVGPAAVDGERRGRRASCRPASRSPATCTASSRVGTTTSACGLPATAAWSKPSSPGARHPVQQRDAEAEGLAGAGLGLADDVVAGQRDRQGHRLDRERAGDAGVGERVDDVRVDREVGERGHGLGLGDDLGDRLGQEGLGIRVVRGGRGVGDVGHGSLPVGGRACAYTGAVGRSEVFGGRVAPRTPGARHVKELGLSCRPGTVGRSSLYR